jgi:hypothetical protein
VALSLLLLPVTALAQRKRPEGGGNPSREKTYEFLIGGDFLARLFPNADPVIMAAENGDRLEIRGEGGFSISPKDIDGGGTFMHKDAAGNEIRRGNWRAVEFLSFRSYGGSGGQLEARIELFPGGQPAGTPGKMQVDCPLGDAPPSSMFEARVVFQDPGLNFNKRVQGGTLFIQRHVDPPICGGITGTCAHPLCSEGGPLDPTCQTELVQDCVARICSDYPECCFYSWFGFCVDAVRTVCGLCCCITGIAPCD